MSIIWDLEDEARSEYVAEWFKDELGLTPNNIDSIREIIKDLDKKNLAELTPKQRDLLNYYKGEDHKRQMIDDIVDILKKSVAFKQSGEYKAVETKIIQQEYKFNGRFYRTDKVEYDQKIVYFERYLIKGKLQERIRDVSTGRFIKRT